MALEQFRLDGQVAIVTGAGRGVGAGIARVLAEAGATTRDWYATNATFHVDGGIESNDSPLPIPDY